MLSASPQLDLLRPDDKVTTGGFVVLVTGGRDYTDEKQVNIELDAIRRQHPNMRLVHGAARGADQLAHQWAVSRNVPVTRYPVESWQDGPWPAAGHRRNRRMFKASQPDLVVAFPGGKGTRGMMKIAYDAGVRVFMVMPHLWVS